MPDSSKRRVTLTRTPAWRALAVHRRAWNGRHLRDEFAADPQRFGKFSLEAGGLLLDYSKNLVDAETLELLCRLARERELPAQIAALLGGKKVNQSEKRAAWHSALRAGHAAPREVRKVLAAMRGFTTALRSGQVAGVTGKPLTDVVSLGIGGSAQGPALASAACAPDVTTPRVHFVTTPGEPLAQLLVTLDPATTLFIVQSKSFTTLETTLNAQAARNWLQAGFDASDYGSHFAAVTANAEAAHAFGVPPERIFPMWDWVGGRYSLWSAVGLPAMIAMGADRFDELLAGAAAMDAHFANEPPERNMPVILGLIGLWQAHFFGAATRAVIPYEPGLALLPAWLQQLEMESLGKSVTQRGRPLRTDSGVILWGSPGMEAQHAYFQLLHQGTRMVPVDFVACCSPRAGDAATHATILANCFAQSALLMRGRSAAEIETQLAAQGMDARTAARLAAHQALPGNRPSNTLLLPALEPRSLGALLALYEHRTFVQAAIWDINAFDQWGVEHGKRLADNLRPAFDDGNTASAPDSSTGGLISYAKKTRSENP
ncbi:MAG: glucose-6-phosphate isomerase [Burkholderiales bacterium]